MAGSVQAALAKAGLTVADVDFVVPHQANKRIVDATMKMLQLPLDKCITNIDEYGNTSSASIPLALADAIRAGQVKKGNVVVFVAFGGGLVVGCGRLALARRTRRRSARRGARERGTSLIRMPTLGVIFPGQGSQTVGMGVDVAQRYAASAECFERASARAWLRSA